MQKRVKHYDRRMKRELEDKVGLLQDVENPAHLKMNVLEYHKTTLIYAKDFSVNYEKDSPFVLEHFNFEIKQGERVFLHGENGSGKSTFIKAILKGPQSNNFFKNGVLHVGAGLVVSYINQDTSFFAEA